MRDKVSFFIISNTSSPIKQVTVSRAFLRFISLSIVACLIFSVFVIFDYCSMKKTIPTIRELESKNSSQQDEIIDQRKQIQKFAGVINMLKSKLVALSNFEKKIRIIANIEKTDAQDGLFGVGGSIPEDLDTKTLLTKKHSSLVREMHERSEQLTLASINQKQAFEYLLKHLENQRKMLPCLKFAA